MRSNGGIAALLPLLAPGALPGFLKAGKGVSDLNRISESEGFRSSFNSATTGRFRHQGCPYVKMSLGIRACKVAAAVGKLADTLSRLFQNDPDDP